MMLGNEPCTRRHGPWHRRGENDVAEFLIGYYGGSQPDTPEAGRAHREKWRAWIDGLGDQVVDPGTGLMGSAMIGPAVATPLMGFAVVRADSKEEAIELAKGDPFLAMGGSIQVAQMMRMGG
jgi:hypothetical protein